MSFGFLLVFFQASALVAGAHDEMDGVFKYGSDKIVDEIMRKNGAVVLGKRTFDISLEKNQLPYGGMVKVPQFVITEEAQEPRTIGGLLFTSVTDGVESAVGQAKAAAGDKDMTLPGTSIDQQCLKAGLVDEIVIHLAPTSSPRNITICAMKNEEKET